MSTRHIRICPECGHDGDKQHRDFVICNYCGKEVEYGTGALKGWVSVSFTAWDDTPLAPCPRLDCCPACRPRFDAADLPWHKEDC
jgi:hypothetical protein